jgi:hypothetical protein
VKTKGGFSEREQLEPIQRQARNESFDCRKTGCKKESSRPNGLEHDYYDFSGI